MERLCASALGSLAQTMPRENVSVTIGCDTNGVCVNNITAIMSAPTMLPTCFLVNSAPNALLVTSASARQPDTAYNDLTNICAPILNETRFEHSPVGVAFTNYAIATSWLQMTGTISTVYACVSGTDPNDICGSNKAYTADATLGEPRNCGNWCTTTLVAKATGRGSCPLGETMRAYTVICSSGGYSALTLLTFDPFRYDGELFVNGSWVGLETAAPSDFTLSEIRGLENPAEGKYLLPRPEAPGGYYVFNQKPRVDDCTNYCGFSREENLETGILTAYGRCASADGCDAESMSSSSPCPISVSVFHKQSNDPRPITTAFTDLPYPARMADIGRGYMELTVGASQLHSDMTLTLRLANVESITPALAANNVEATQLLTITQDAQHEDIIVVFAPGDVVTSGVPCALTLVDSRHSARMYTVQNPSNDTLCDVYISNGTATVKRRVPLERKWDDPGRVTDTDAVWWKVPGYGLVPPKVGSGVGIGVGLGVGLGMCMLVTLAATVILTLRWKRWCCRWWVRRAAEKKSPSRTRLSHNNPLSSAASTGAS